MSNIAGALYRVTKIANEMKCRESVESFILSHNLITIIYNLKQEAQLLLRQLTLR